MIGITGTQGAGKDTVAEYLTKQTHFQHLSLSAIVRDETARLGLEQVRDNWRTVADGLRATGGNGIFAKKILEKITTDYSDVLGFIITSIRHPDEIAVLKKAYQNFYLLAVDAPIALRYERICGRGNLADAVSFDHFKLQEEKENVRTDVGMRIREAVALADATIINDGDTDNLYKLVDTLFNKYYV